MSQFDSGRGYQLSASGPGTVPPKDGWQVRLLPGGPPHKWKEFPFMPDTYHNWYVFASPVLLVQTPSWYDGELGSTPRRGSQGALEGP
jgi:hypothetical protein